MIRYEDLLTSPELEIEKVSTLLKVHLKEKTGFENILESTKDKSESFYTYREYYLNEDWKVLLNQTDVRYINSFLSMDVLNALNYEKLNPNNFN